MLTLFGWLPVAWQLMLAKWRFSYVRGDFYRETRLDVAKHGLRNSETLKDRVQTHLKRAQARNHWTWPVYAGMAASLKRGDNFAAAMKPFIPNDEYTLLDLSRTSSRKDAVRQGFELAEVSAAAKAVLKGAVSAQVSYPAILMIAVFMYSMLFGGAVFPDVVDLKPVSEWPVLGQTLYAIDTFNFRHYVLVGIGVVLCIVAYFKTLDTWTGKLRTQIDAIPFLYRNHRDLRAAILLVSLAALFTTGLTFRQAIAKLQATADPWLHWHLSEMSNRLSAHPDKPMEALSTGLFSQLIIDKISDAAGRDQFEEAITSLGNSALARIVETVQANAKRVHLILLGMTGMLFLFICLGSYAATGMVAMTAFGSMH